MEAAVRNPNDANALGIGMVHQHFKLVECFSVLDMSFCTLLFENLVFCHIISITFVHSAKQSSPAARKNAKRRDALCRASRPGKP